MLVWMKHKTQAISTYSEQNKYKYNVCLFWEYMFGAYKHLLEVFEMHCFDILNLNKNMIFLHEFTFTLKQITLHRRIITFINKWVALFMLP